MSKVYEAELLAPAGDVVCAHAAINAGADAVYIGASLFNARAYANNPNKDELLELIDFVHLQGKKIYLTLNILLKSDEINMLDSFLRPYYEQGLDAVIVQDLGVIKYVREHFPDLDVHVSTQATATTKYSAKIYKELGCTRLVTPRELSFKEIKDIKAATDLEIESFIHGALCYCYSGQCLYSSVVGDRSGNRGKCAQPCRLNFNTVDGKSYYLSMKDLCTIDILPEILKAGVYSLKIEGRMKKPEYVACVVSVYRKYLDLAQNGINYEVSAEDMNILADIYNRGGFTDGYYNEHNGKDMLSLTRPNHMGTLAFIKAKDSKFKAVCNLKKNDNIEVLGFTFNITKDIQSGEVVDIDKVVTFAGNKSGITVNKKADKIFRTRNQALIEKINSEYIKTDKKIPVKASVRVHVGEPITISYAINDDIYVGAVGTEIVMEANNRPASYDEIKKQVSKLGNTMFMVSEIKVDTDNKSFLNLAECNNVRRMAIDTLKDKILVRYRRKSLFKSDEAGNRENVSEADFRQNKKSYSRIRENNEIIFNALVYNKYQADMALKSGLINVLYLEDMYFPKNDAMYIAKGHGNVYLALPYIMRQEDFTYFDKKYSTNDLLEFKGFLVRSLDEYAFLSEKGFNNFVFDYNIYGYNNESKGFLNNYNVKLTAPFELEKHELKELDISDEELVVYGNLPLMITAQDLYIYDVVSENDLCIVRKITDRMGNESYYLHSKAYNQSLLYNSKPVSLLNRKNDILKLNPNSMRIVFTSESEEEVLSVLASFQDIFLYDKNIDETNFDSGRFTKAHFERKV